MKKAAIIIANVLVFWLFLPFLLIRAGGLLDAWAGAPVLPLAVRMAAGIPLAVIGAYIALHSMLLLRTRGKGLPISSLPPTELVTEGFYGRCRHPLYLGYMLLVLGAALLFGSPCATAVVVPVVAFLWMILFVKLYEEPVLLRRFGARYSFYIQDTPLLLPFRIEEIARRFIVFCLRRCLDVEISGEEKIPSNGPCILYTNHTNYLDFVFGQLVMKRRMLIPVTEEVFRSPLRRAFMRMMGGWPVKRYAPDPSAANALRSKLAAGGAVGLAPEGERSWTGALQPLLPNSVANMIRFDGPIIPVGASGAYGLMPRWARSLNRGRKVVIRVGDPVSVRSELEKAEIKPDSRDAVPYAEKILRERLQALLLPDHLSVDIAALKDFDLTLVLFQCPLCRADRALYRKGAAGLACGSCSAEWEIGRDLRLKGEKEPRTIKEWFDRIEVPSCPAPREDGAVLSAKGVRLLRLDAAASVPARPLRRLGNGTIELRPESLWFLFEEGGSTEIRIEDVRSVTTERNDTLQIFSGGALTHFVFSDASPLRWQMYIERMPARRQGDKE